MDLAPSDKKDSGLKKIKQNLKDTSAMICTLKNTLKLST